MKKTTNKTYHFAVIIEKDANGYFIGKVPSLKSCYTQAPTLALLYQRLDEVVALSMETERQIFKNKFAQNEFIGVQQLEFTA